VNPDHDVADNPGMMIECAVIGAGHAGLAVSWHLAQRGIDHVVFEQGRVGESWRAQRWDSFVLNSPSWANVLPGQLEPVAPRDGFLIREAWVSQLDAYASAQRLPVRQATRITCLERASGDLGSFRLRTDGGDEVEARSVVVAAGSQRVPKLPAIAAGLPPEITSLHTSGYRRPDQLPAGGVLVVGSAQSGGQVAEDLLDSGRRVYVSASTVARWPRRYRGRDIFEWLAVAGFFDQTVEQLADPRMRFAALPIISGVGRYGHTLSLQFLVARGAVLLGHLQGISDGRLELAGDLVASISFADRFSAEARDQIERAIREEGIAAPPAEPDAADETMTNAEGLASPSELDLEKAGIGTVIWATGFGADLSWIKVPVTDPTGAVLHDGGRSPTPGLWFLGIPWMRSRKSAIILGANDDGAAIADQVVEHLAGTV
jgi:putative flavoprotein involved in K+ transport